MTVGWLPLLLLLLLLLLSSSLLLRLLLLLLLLLLLSFAIRRVPTELGLMTNLRELFLHNNDFYSTAETAAFLKGPLLNCYISV